MNSVRTSQLIALVILVCSTSALGSGKKKAACKEGWIAASKGICYQLGDTTVMGGMTTVDFQITSPRAYQGIMMVVSMFKDGKLACTGQAVAQNVQKDEDTAVKGMCSKEVTQPEKVVIRIDTTL